MPMQTAHTSNERHSTLLCSRHNQKMWNSQKVLWKSMPQIHCRTAHKRLVEAKKEITTICTILVNICLMGINLITSAAERETEIPKTLMEWIISKQRIIDDITITTHIPIIGVLDETVSWARMELTPKKF